jgi:hypothetical protein
VSTAACLTSDVLVEFSREFDLLTDRLLESESCYLFDCMFHLQNYSTNFDQI